MSYGVNDIVRFELEWGNTNWNTKYRNVLNFRGFTGELAVDSGPTILTTFVDTWLTRILANHMTDTHLLSVRLYNVSQPNDPAEQQNYSIGEKNGDVIGTGDETPQASACIVRQTYSRGRKSIGRYFHGPLASYFHDAGRVVADPVGSGDLGDVLDALGDPINVTGYVLRPIVCGATTTVGTSRMDIRTNRVSQHVSFMKSRRMGTGE